MKIEVEKISASSVQLKIEVPAEIVQTEFDRNYQIAKKGLAVSGFRPGYAPKSFVLKRYKEQIQSETIQKIIPEAYTKALKIEKLFPISEPKMQVEMSEIERDKPISFTATVNVRPEIKLPNFHRDLQLDRIPTNIERREVDQYIALLQEENATFTPIDTDRTVEKNDCINIDLKCFVDNQLDEKETMEDVDVELAVEEGLKAEIKSEIYGMKVGDSKPIEMKIEEGQLAGKNVRFEVTLNAITEKQLPEIDDEFAKDLKFDNHDRMYGAVWKHLVDTKKIDTYVQQKNELVRQLMEKVELQVPESVVDSIIQASIEGREKDENNQKVDAKSIPENVRTSVANQVKLEWIFDELGRTLEVEVSDNELAVEIHAAARERGHDPHKYANLLRANGKIEEFRRNIQNEKICEFLVASAKTKKIIEPTSIDPIETSTREVADRGVVDPETN